MSAMPNVATILLGILYVPLRACEMVGTAHEKLKEWESKLRGKL